MALTPLFVPGLLANDMDRTSPIRVAAGAGLAAAFVVPTTWWLQSIVEGAPLELAWVLVAASSFIAIFWKSMRQLYRHYRPVKVTDEAEIESTREISVGDHEAQVWRLFTAADEHDLEEVVQFEELVDVDAVRALRPAATPPNVVGEPLFDIHSLERLDQITWPQVEPREQLTWPRVERRKAGRPWVGRPVSDKPAVTVPEDLAGITWQQLVPNVYFIDSTAWSPKGNRRWQDAHPDAWDDAEGWLTDALAPAERDSQVA